VRPHAVFVHVLEPLDRVIAARTHIVVAGGFDVPRTRVLAGDGIEADLRVLTAGVHP